MAQLCPKRSGDGVCKLSRGEKQRKTRISNACEACKKRKCKCNGPPSPCTACANIDAYCHFSPKLDFRRKGSYKPSFIQERQQFFLLGILRTLKHGEYAGITKLLNLIRNTDPPEDLAVSLKETFLDLQRRHLLPAMDFDETDILSIGLQSMYDPHGDLWPLKVVSDSSEDELDDDDDAPEHVNGTSSDGDISQLESASVTSNSNVEDSRIRSNLTTMKDLTQRSPIHAMPTSNSSSSWGRHNHASSMSDSFSHSGTLVSNTSPRAFTRRLSTPILIDPSKKFDCVPIASAPGISSSSYDRPTATLPPHGGWGWYHQGPFCMDPSYAAVGQPPEYITTTSLCESNWPFFGTQKQQVTEAEVMLPSRPGHEGAHFEDAMRFVK